MNRVFSRTAVLTASFVLFGSFVRAQTAFPEIEPNSTKAEATANGAVTLASGDSLSGTSSGSTATVGSTAVTTADMWRVRTAALPLGIYRHELAVTTTGVAGHTGTIRGLLQTGGVINSTSDTQIQGSQTTTTPPRMNAWYGFGKQEEIFYRITGASATTAPYAVTLTTTPITATAIPGTFAAGPITITSFGQSHTTNTEIYVYDSALNPVSGAHNDDPTGQGQGPSTVITTLGGGTYYVAISTFNVANDQSDVNAGEQSQTFAVMDFPNVVATSLATTGQNLGFSVTDGVVTSNVAATKSLPFEVRWYSMVVAGVVTPPANDACANAAAITSTSTVAAIATATQDGAASCDPGATNSKDVWYTYLGGPNGGTLSLDTLGSTAVDTVLSVHSSCGGAELACNDDCPGAPTAPTTSCVSVALAPNQIVWIRVSDKGLGGAASVLNSLFTPNPPTHDDCSTPIALAGPGLYAYDTTLATTGVQGQSESLCNFFGSTSIPFDVWYTYAATTTGTITISTCGLTTVGSPSDDTKISIHGGTGCPFGGSALACNDDDVGCTSGFGFESRVGVAATCGATFSIQLGVSGAVTTGSYGQFSITETGGSVCSTPVTYVCFGDGTGTACPCANVGAPGNGCASSVNTSGANLAAFGIASVTGDTWTLSGTGLPNGPGLYFQGTTLLASGAGAAFGDGLRCVGGSVVRLGIVTGVASVSSYPSPNPPAVNAIPISTKGLVTPGALRHYQLWYRDSGAFCSASVFNLTGAVTVTWLP